MSHQYLYLKLLLRNNLLLDLDEYALVDTKEYGLVCNFMDMKLASAFQPVLRPDGKVVGREALLRAGLLEHGEVTPDGAFEEAVQVSRVVQFDRLVRIIHLMTHARSFAEHELLFLNVHPRLLSSVINHGRTFEQILHYYSVPTSRVVIEIREAANVDEAGLTNAVNNYRIAVDNFGAAHSSLERVIRLQTRYRQTGWGADPDGRAVARHYDLIQQAGGEVSQCGHTGRCRRHRDCAAVGDRQKVRCRSVARLSPRAPRFCCPSAGATLPRWAASGPRTMWGDCRATTAANYYA